MARGEFQNGFPTDRALMHTYRVSRHTAREAARHLQSEGVLRRHKGRGSFVHPIAIEQRVGPLYSLFRSIEDQGHVQRSDVLALSAVRDKGIAEKMGLPHNTRLFYLRRLRRADGTPFAIDEIWLPASVAKPLFKVNFEHTAVYAELERLTGVRPTRGWERIRPALPDAQERRLLGIASEQPVFVVNRYTESEDGPLEWRSTVVRGDAYTFTTSWTGNNTSSHFGVHKAQSRSGKTTKRTRSNAKRPRLPAQRRSK